MDLFKSRLKFNVLGRNSTGSIYCGYVVDLLRNAFFTPNPQLLNTPRKRWTTPQQIEQMEYEPYTVLTCILYCPVAT